MYNYFLAKNVGINEFELALAQERARIQSERYHNRQGDGAAIYNPETQAGRMFQSVRDGYISRKTINLDYND